jgi:hypothetical protein
MAQQLAAFTFAAPTSGSNQGASAPASLSGTASGINNAAARVGSLVAIAALGHAFGDAETEALRAERLANAYRLVLLAATVLAVLSAVTAATALQPGKRAAA